MRCFIVDADAILSVADAAIALEIAVLANVFLPLAFFWKRLAAAAAGRFASHVWQKETSAKFTK